MSNNRTNRVIINERKKIKIIIPKNKSLKPYSVPIDYEIKTLHEQKMDRLNRKIKDINNDTDDFIDYLKDKFADDLEYYEYIKRDKMNTLVNGGFIRYITFDENLKYGGILVKVLNINDLNKTKLLLKNSKKQIWSILTKNFHIFYKQQLAIDNAVRELFINSEYYQ